MAQCPVDLVRDGKFDRELKWVVLSDFFIGEGRSLSWWWQAICVDILFTEETVFTSRHSVFHFLRVPSAWHRMDSLCPYHLDWLALKHGGAVPMHNSVLGTLLHFYNDIVSEVCLSYFFSFITSLCVLWLCSLILVAWCQHCLSSLLVSYARLPRFHSWSVHPGWLWVPPPPCWSLQFLCL